MKYFFSILFLLFAPFMLGAQESLSWQSSSKKISEGLYELSFTTTVTTGNFIYLSALAAKVRKHFKCF